MDEGVQVMLFMLGFVVFFGLIYLIAIYFDKTKKIKPFQPPREEYHKWQAQWENSDNFNEDVDVNYDQDI